MNMLLIFCATTLGTLTLIAVLVFLLVRKIPEKGILAPLARIFDRGRDIFFVLASVVFAIVFDTILKHIFHIARPSGGLLTLSDFSFPSGHASVYMALAASLFLINRKAGIFALISALIVGVARVLIGVHTSVDIMGGYILGMFTVILLMRFFPYFTKQK